MDNTPIATDNAQVHLAIPYELVAGAGFGA